MKTTDLDLLRIKLHELKELNEKREKLQEEIWDLEYNSNASEELEYELDEYTDMMEDYDREVEGEEEYE